jgi:hypothetical protein
MAKEKQPANWLTKLVDRLCALPAQDVTNFVGPQVIRDEIGRAIDRFCENEDHATRTVDALVFRSGSETVWRPTPVEIRDAAQATPVEVSKMLPASANCPDCNGTGAEILEECPSCSRFLSSRQFIEGVCPKCQAKSSYRVSCARECRCRKVGTAA